MGVIENGTLHIADVSPLFNLFFGRSPVVQTGERVAFPIAGGFLAKKVFLWLRITI